MLDPKTNYSCNSSTARHITEINPKKADHIIATIAATAAPIGAAVIKGFI